MVFESTGLLLKLFGPKNSRLHTVFLKDHSAGSVEARFTGIRVEKGNPFGRLYP